MFKKLALAFFLSTFVLLASANAQNDIAPEKQAAIKEIVALMNADNQIEQMVQVFSSQMDDTRRQTVKAILNERTDLSPAEKKQIEDSLLANDKVGFKKYQERLLAKLDYQTVMNEMMLVVYDKFFTLEELKDLLVFYKSPTGQKMLKLMPDIAAESMKVTQEKLLPKLLNALKEIEQEDRRDIEQKIDAKKPRAKKPAAK
jgi:uncharacterized protein